MPTFITALLAVLFQLPFSVFSSMRQDHTHIITETFLPQPLNLPSPQLPHPQDTQDFVFVLVCDDQQSRKFFAGGTAAADGCSSCPCRGQKRLLPWGGPAALPPWADGSGSAVLAPGWGIPGTGRDPRSPEPRLPLPGEGCSHHSGAGSRSRAEVARLREAPLPTQGGAPGSTPLLRAVRG